MIRFFLSALKYVRHCRIWCSENIKTGRGHGKEKTHNISLGKHGERIACDHLQRKGFTILETNMKTPFGEIDIIAGTKTSVIAIEVKTRCSGYFGTVLYSIDDRKKEHIRKSFFYYLNRIPVKMRNIRIDVISIKVDTCGKLMVLEYIKNAIEARDDLSH